MTTQSKHTPGPWIAEQNGNVPDRPWTVGRLFYNVADVGCEADARLIAQAPALLEALEQLISDLDEYVQHPAFDGASHPQTVDWSHARSLISQIKGGGL